MYPTNQPIPPNTPTPSARKALRLARQDIAHVFPGIVRILLNPKDGTIKTSFTDTKIFAILKHRALWVRILTKRGLGIDPGDNAFSIGTWRYADGKGGKKKLYHVLTLHVPKTDARGVLCTFKPLWQRAIRQKTDEEIDRELNALLSNRKALIKRLGLSTTIHQ